MTVFQINFYFYILWYFLFRHFSPVIQVILKRERERKEREREIAKREIEKGIVKERESESERECVREREIVKRERGEKNRKRER